MTQLSNLSIIGGGIAGLTAAAYLSKTTDYRITVIDPNPNKTPPPSMAVAVHNTHILDEIGVKGGYALEGLHLYDGSSHVFYDGDDAGKPNLLTVYSHESIINGALENAKFNLVQGSAVDITDKGVVLADNTVLSVDGICVMDGRFSKMRDLLGIPSLSWFGNDTCSVTKITHEVELDSAYEVWDDAWSLTVVPIGKHESSIIWTRPKDEGYRWYLDGFLRRLPINLGQCQEVDKVYNLPLSMVWAPRMVKNNIILLAEAAHGLPAIGAQGFNLSLSDIACLSKNLSDHNIEPAFTRTERQQRPRIAAFLGVTGALNALTVTRSPMLQGLRAWGLQKTNHKTIKQRIMRALG